jgi:hypothetical protein
MRYPATRSVPGSNLHNHVFTFSTLTLTDNYYHLFHLWDYVLELATITTYLFKLPDELHG